MGHAIRIGEQDNVATVVDAVGPGEKVTVTGADSGDAVAAAAAIPAGHKIAVAGIEAGAPVVKYGEVIGVASAAIARGAHVHSHNLDALRAHAAGRAILHPLPQRGAGGEGEATGASMLVGGEGLPRTFPGFRRPDGRVGIRNHILVVPMVLCANRAAEAIAEGMTAVAVSHVYGCDFDARGNELLERILVGMGSHPNVAGVVVVALGCETSSMDKVIAGIAAAGTPVEGVRIQDAGTPQTIARGREIVARLARRAADLRLEPCDAGELVVAVECGGSDGFSGLSANPAAGAAADLLVAAGGTVILSETTEIVGAEQVLARRCADEETRRRLLQIVSRTEARLQGIEEFAGGVYITPGNLDGGLTTLEEKSLGCIHKGGTTPVVEVVDYAEPTSRRGLVVMDTPGHDVASVTGKVAAGAQIVCFTTGRGTPTGCAIAPVVKVCSNSAVARRMADHIDVDAGAILTGEESIPAAGRRIYERILAAAAGDRTKSEVLGHCEFMVGRPAGELGRRRCE